MVCVKILEKLFDGTNKNSGVYEIQFKNHEGKHQVVKNI